MDQIHPKAAAGALAGAVTSILVWALEQAGVKIPADQATALTTILSFVAAWLIPANLQEKS